MYSFRVATTETQAYRTLHVLAVARIIGFQAIITTINPAHLHLTEKIHRMHQHGRIGGPDFGLGLLLVAWLTIGGMVHERRHLYAGQFTTGNAHRSSDVVAVQADDPLMTMIEAREVQIWDL